MKPVAKAPRRRVRGKASSNANTDSHEMVQAGQNGIPIEQPVHGDTPCQIVQAECPCSTLSRGRIPGSRKVEGKEQVYASGPYARLWNCYYKCIELLLTNEIEPTQECILPEKDKQIVNGIMERREAMVLKRAQKRARIVERQLEQKIEAKLAERNVRRRG